MTLPLSSQFVPGPHLLLGLVQVGPAMCCGCGPVDRGAPLSRLLQLN